MITAQQALAIVNDSFDQNLKRKLSTIEQAIKKQAAVGFKSVAVNCPEHFLQVVIETLNERGYVVKVTTEVDGGIPSLSISWLYADDPEEAQG